MERVYLSGELEEIVEKLIQMKEEGKSVYCVFQNHVLCSDDVTLDSAFLEITGLTYRTFLIQRKFSYEKYNNERTKREEGYKALVEANRKEGVNPITLDNALAGLKFIAENQSLTQEELIEGLLDLGCNYTFEDIKKQFAKEIESGEANTIYHPAGMATIIVNTRDSEFGRSMCISKYLEIDDEYSIYNIIRVVTGDTSYTKENLDSRKINRL